MLEDLSIFEGCAFGARAVRVGEVVFTTTMNGYPEALTDPSYKGQILIMTHPMVGNYGVPDPNIIDPKSNLPLHYESNGIKVEGFVIARLTKPNHWASVKDLDEWFKEEGVPGIQGVDTRMLVKKIREKGVMMGAITTTGDVEDAIRALESAPRYDEVDYVSSVRPPKVMEHGSGEPVALLDCGVKYGIVRELASRGLKVIRVPCGEGLKILDEVKGVVLANGPGNPTMAMEKYNLHKFVEAAYELGLPILAICLGHQILNMTFGGRVYKMKYGHRGVNKPVKDSEGRCFIVSENHGYAVDPKTIDNVKFRKWFVNPDDNTLEGVISKDPKRPVFSVQFHPESSPGPHDTLWIFDKFASEVKAQ
nr:glutamine-hydrolyzing carbamoyl-phosphate synthase small subunit [Ignicoccus hospitalis]